jgi:hypothetical protein
MVEEARRRGFFPSVHQPVRGNVISERWRGNEDNTDNLEVLFSVLSTIVVGEVGR